MATVHVEAGWDPGDPRGRDALAGDARQAAAAWPRAMSPRPLCPAPMRRPLVEAQAAFPRVVGIRDILSWDPDPARRFAARGDLMGDPAWRAGLRALGQASASSSTSWSSPASLPRRRGSPPTFPTRPSCSNHCGSPIDRDADGMRRWRDGLRAVARSPNVAIKISDLVAYDPHWTLESLRRCGRSSASTAFGPDRAMFGSDFPVAGLWASFEAAYGAFKDIASDFTPDEQRALFYGNARQTYQVSEAANGSA